MRIVDMAVKKIRAIADGPTREIYARALRSSVVWEGVEDDRLPTSAEAVLVASGLGAELLESNLILLAKKDLPAFADEHGLTKSLITIRKSLTASTYADHFSDNRKEVRNGRKLLITHAEARSILRVRTSGNMPTI